MTTALRSAVIDAPLGKVWGVVGDFGGIASWIPFVVSCAMEDEASPAQVGAVRRVRQDDGVDVRERLVALSQIDHAMSYALVEGNIPLRSYTATLRLLPVTDGDRALLHWSAVLLADAADEAGLVRLVESSWMTAIEGARAVLAARD